MKKLFSILCVIAILPLACASGSAVMSKTAIPAEQPAPVSHATVLQPPTTSMGYTSFEDIDLNVLIEREQANKRTGNGPTSPIPNVSLSVGSLAELDNINSLNRSLLFYCDGKFLYVGTRLYGPSEVMNTSNSWYLGGYARQAFQMDVSTVEQDGKTELNGLARLPLIPGIYRLYHWAGASSSPTWTYPLWSCPAYGLWVVNGEELWGYLIKVLPSGQVVTVNNSDL